MSGPTSEHDPERISDQAAVHLTALARTWRRLAERRSRRRGLDDLAVVAFGQCAATLERLVRRLQSGVFDEDDEDVEPYITADAP